MKTIQDHFLDQLAAICDAESQYVTSLTEWIESSSYPILEPLMQILIQEAQGHVEVIGYIFSSFCTTPRRVHHEAVSEIIQLHQEKTDTLYFSAFARESALFSVLAQMKILKVGLYTGQYHLAELLGNERATAYLFELLDEEMSSCPLLHSDAHTGFADSMQAAQVDESRVRG
jgi:ferritin-like metal-binding protein YciE